MSGGAGGVFRRMECGGEGGSGALPTASRSNIDSRSESYEARAGAGGSGLLRSVGDEITEDGELKDCLCAESRACDCGLVTAAAVAVEGSSRSSILMSFPCRELGGRGFFLPFAEDGRSGPRPSSSGSDVSCGVLGESRCGS